MAKLGNIINNLYFNPNVFTATSGQTTFTLSKPSTQTTTLVFVNGLKKPLTSYAINGNILQFNTGLNTGDTVDVVFSSLVNSNFNQNITDNVALIYDFIQDLQNGINVVDNKVFYPPLTNTVSISDVLINESVGTATITFSISAAPTAGTASVDWATTAGTAIAGADYTSASGTISWAIGDATNKTATVLIIDDALVESSEAYQINLTNAVNCTIADGSATVTINDNDSVAPPPPSSGAMALGMGVSGSIIYQRDLKYSNLTHQMRPWSAFPASDILTQHRGHLTLANSGVSVRAYLMTFLAGGDYSNRAGTYIVRARNPAGGQIWVDGVGVTWQNTATMDNTLKEIGRFTLASITNLAVEDSNQVWFTGAATFNGELQIIKQTDLALHDSGCAWSQEFLNWWDKSNASVIRWMDMIGPLSIDRDWADRPLLSDVIWIMPPWEAMLDFQIRTGIRSWWTTQATMNANYLTQLGSLVSASSVDYIHLEVPGNEAWNSTPGFVDSNAYCGLYAATKRTGTFNPDDSIHYVGHGYSNGTELACMEAPENRDAMFNALEWSAWPLGRGTANKVAVIDADNFRFVPNFPAWVSGTVYNQYEQVVHANIGYMVKQGVNNLTSTVAPNLDTTNFEVYNMRGYAGRTHVQWAHNVAGYNQTDVINGTAAIALAHVNAFLTTCARNKVKTHLGSFSGLATYSRDLFLAIPSGDHAKFDYCALGPYNVGVSGSIRVRPNNGTLNLAFASLYREGANAEMYWGIYPAAANPTNTQVINGTGSPIHHGYAHPMDMEYVDTETLTGYTVGNTYKLVCVIVNDYVSWGMARVDHRIESTFTMTASLQTLYADMSDAQKINSDTVAAEFYCYTLAQQHKQYLPSNVKLSGYEFGSENYRLAFYNWDISGEQYRFHGVMRNYYNSSAYKTVMQKMFHTLAAAGYEVACWFKAGDESVFGIDNAFEVETYREQAFEAMNGTVPKYDMPSLTSLEFAQTTQPGTYPHTIGAFAGTNSSQVEIVGGNDLGYFDVSGSNLRVLNTASGLNYNQMNLFSLLIKHGNGYLDRFSTVAVQLGAADYIHIYDMTDVAPDFSQSNVTIGGNNTELQLTLGTSYSTLYIALHKAQPNKAGTPLGLPATVAPGESVELNFKAWHDEASWVADWTPWQAIRVVGNKTSTEHEFTVTLNTLEMPKDAYGAASKIVCRNDTTETFNLSDGLAFMMVQNNTTGSSISMRIKDLWVRKV